MTYSTTKTYTLKHETLSFTNKVSNKLSKLDRKFTADSCLLADVVD